MKSTFLSSRPLSLDLGLLFLRLITGAGLITHGYPKFMKVINGDMQFGDPLGLGQGTSLFLSAFAEFICAGLVILGLLTRVASLAVVINMAVAFFIVHAADDFGTKEMSMLYLSAFLAIFLTGPGRYSVDSAVFDKPARL